MRRRVVVTGIGWVNPLGTEIDRVWQRLLAGDSGVGMISRFDASNFSHEDRRRGARLGPFRRWGRTPRTGNIKVSTHDLPWAQARRPLPIRASKTPLLIRLGSASIRAAAKGSRTSTVSLQMMVAALEGETLDVVKFTKKGLEILNPICELEQEPNMPAAHLAGLFDAQGPNVNCLTACAASSQAIGEAVEIIRRNEADLMLAGGTHTMIHPFGVTGFNLLTALSTYNENPAKASRPFDRNRGRFRARRRRRHGHPRRARARQAAGREDLRRARRVRFDRRRLPDHRHPTPRAAAASVA